MEFKQYVLKDILEERKEYSLKGEEYEHVSLTMDGIIPKGERYDRDFLVKSEDKKYKISRLNDICYNPANLKFGVITINEYGDVIFSPIYVTLKLKEKYEKEINVKYLYYFLSSNIFLEKVRKYEQGTVYERQAVGINDFLKMKIGLPNKTEQEQFIRILENEDKLIKSYNSKIENYNNLIKSQFVEMFGSIDSIEKWERKKWKDVVTIINGKDYKSIEVEKGGYPVYGSGGIIARANTFSCPEKSIIVGRKGSINNPLLIMEKYWNVDTAFSIVPKKEINYLYLFYFCKQFNFMKLNKASTLPSTTKTDLLKIDINVPPIGNQEQFANMVEQVDKLKFRERN